MHRTTSPQGYYDRIASLISPSFHEKSVVLVGCGAASDLAVKLARLGPARMTLIDPDVVEISNLTRTVYSITDLGVPKVDALARHVASANSGVGVRPIQADVTTIDAATDASVFSAADIIIAATDSFVAHAYVNQVSQRLGIPAVFVGVHEGAEGGLVIGCIPGETGCYRCVNQARYDVATEGTTATDLASAPGLFVDISFVDTIALKLVLAILERGHATPLGRFLEDANLRTYVVCRMSRHHGYSTNLWHEILGRLPTAEHDLRAELEAEVLFAMDTLWFPVSKDEACPACHRFGS